MASRTSEFYKNNPESAEKRRKYQRKYNKKKAKLKVKSHKTGKPIQPDSDSRNHVREARRNGQNTKGKNYDHATGRMISEKANKSKKDAKSIKFRVKGKKKK